MRGLVITWPWVVLWSLAIEEVFYFFFPMICKFFRYHLSVVAMLIAFVIFGPAYRQAHGYVSIIQYFGCF